MTPTQVLSLLQETKSGVCLCPLSLNTTAPARQTYSVAELTDIFRHSIWPRLQQMGWFLQQGSNEGETLFVSPSAKTRPPKWGLDFFLTIKEVLLHMEKDPGLRMYCVPPEYEGVFDSIRAPVASSAPRPSGAMSLSSITHHASFRTPEMRPEPSASVRPRRPGRVPPPWPVPGGSGIRR